VYRPRRNKGDLLRHGRLITTGLAALAALAIVPASAGAAVIDDDDFSGGAASADTWVVEPGVLRLKPAVSANFEGLELPQGWTMAPWSTGGSATVVGGAVRVDGARLTSDSLPVSSGVLEFRGTFTPAEFQHVGFGLTLEAADQPWAIFGTGGGSATLLARAQDPLPPTPDPSPLVSEIPIGPIAPPAVHTYRIEWSATGVSFFVDDELKATHPDLIASQMGPILSDLTPGTAADAVTVDWIGVSPYPNSGKFVSKVHDAGSSLAVWDTLTPTGDSRVSFETRSGNTSTPDSSWSEYESVTDGAVQSPPGRYIQYRATLTTNDDRFTPSVDGVQISYELDEAPPNATSIDGVDVSGTTATLRFANTDTDVTRFECKLDGGEFATCTSPKQFTGLSAGSHTAAVRAIDKVGNEGQTVSQPFTVASSTGTGTPPRTGGGSPKPSTGTSADTKAPLVAIGARSIRVSKRAAIRLKCPADETKCTISVRLKYGRKTAGQKTVTAVGGQTVKAKVLLSSAARTRLAKRGRLNVTAIVTARDAAGNSKRREFAMTLRPL
jgi:hypothetical protein